MNSAIQNLKSNQQLSEEQRQRISKLWQRLQDRVTGTANIREVAEKAGVGSLLDCILSQAKEKGFYIIPIGDLETCFTPQAKELGESIDRRALEIAHRIEECTTYEDVHHWMSHLSIFEELLDDVLEFPD